MTDENNNMNRDNNSSKRGFAAMKENNPERQKEIAAEGGRTAHSSGRAHEWDSESGRAAGKKSRSGGGHQNQNEGGSTQQGAEDSDTM